MLTVVDVDGMTPNGSLIDEIVREGARRMLAAALEAEVNSYLAELADQRDAGVLESAARGVPCYPRTEMLGSQARECGRRPAEDGASGGEERYRRHL
jgi:hypothetical protein